MGAALPRSTEHSPGDVRPGLKARPRWRKSKTNANPKWVFNLGILPTGSVKTRSHETPTNAMMIHVAMSQLQSLFTASVLAFDIAIASAVSLCERALRALIYKTEKSAVNNIHGFHIFELTKFHDCLLNERFGSHGHGIGTKTVHKTLPGSYNYLCV